MPDERTVRRARYARPLARLAMCLALLVVAGGCTYGKTVSLTGDVKLPADRVVTVRLHEPTAWPAFAEQAEAAARLAGIEAVRAAGDATAVRLLADDTPALLGLLARRQDLATQIRSIRWGDTSVEDLYFRHASGPTVVRD